VDGSQTSSVTSQYIGGTMANDTYHAGVTHSVHFKNVTDGHLTINVTNGFLARAVVGAIQIVQLPSASTRTRLYVDKNAVGFNNGGTWTNAMTDLQEALDAASLGGGSHFEVWVANAFYYPGTTRDDTFKIASGLKIYGGFAGTESSLSQRPSPFANPTYLSGSIGASGNADDCYTVVTLQNCDNQTEFDGFYIARGNNDGTGHGGGMIISGGFAPRIRNCDFTTNTASNGGGHIYSTSSYPDIINCVFFRGDASNGVGGAIEAAGPIGSLTVQNCKFLGNTATGEGGAVYTSSLFSDFTNCLFSGNSTDFQAGAIRAAGSSGTMTLRNCTLSKNSTLGTCGGIYTSGGNDVVLYNNIIWGNMGNAPATTTDQGAYASTASGSSITASYNTWQGLSADPLFVNAAGPDGIPGNFDDDCHLRQGSPAIDFGDSGQLPNDIDDLDHNGILVEPVPVDLDGLTRRIDIPSAANFGVGAPTIDRGCYEFQLTDWCYANCDNSTTAPVLNVLDFSCYLNKFAAGDSYANCDNSTVAPVLNVLDFSCFLNKFAAGCP
jgi:predicted outer membrane repeat protein